MKIGAIGSFWDRGVGPGLTTPPNPYNESQSGPLAQLSKKNATGEAPLRGVELWLRESAQPVAPPAP
jgi:hypothetical protein